MLYINAYRTNSVYQKLKLKDHLHIFGKRRMIMALDFCQKDDVKNKTSL